MRPETRGRVYGPVTFSSRKSGCCMRVNSTAKPPSMWRTTRLGVLPSVISVPTSGRCSLEIAAPESDMSTMRQMTAVPSGSDHGGARIARHDAVVAAVLGQPEDLAVGEPGQLRGKLVALARGRGDRHRKTVRQDADNRAFEPADVIDIGDDALARDAAHRADDRHAAGRHVEHLTGEFAPVGQHVAAEQIHAHALEAALFLVQRENVEYFLQHGHAA